jgi:hypothetical protein
MATQRSTTGESLLKPILYQCPNGRLYTRQADGFVRLHQTSRDLRPCADSAREMHLGALAAISVAPYVESCLTKDGEARDPHLAQLLEWRACRARYDALMSVQDEETPETESLYAQRWAIYESAACPTVRTISGALCLLAMIYEDARGVDGLHPPHATGLRNLILSLCCMVPGKIAEKVLEGL